MPAVYDKFEKLPNGKYRPVAGNKPAAVAKDSARVDPIGDALADRIVANLVGARVCRNTALDAAADDEIAELLPALRAAVARDDAEGEQQQYGEPEGNDEEERMTIADRIAASYRAAKGFWKKSATRSRQRSQFAGSTGRYPSATATDDNGSKPNASKHDLVAANAKAAKQTSGFARF